MLLHVRVLPCLRSEIAVQANINIMRAFFQMQEALLIVNFHTFYIEKSNKTCFIQNNNVTLHAKYELVMEIQTVKIGNEKLIPSGASREGISVRRSGIAKVLWHKLNVNVPESKVIAGGVDIYKG